MTDHPITPPPELATCIEMIGRAYAAGAEGRILDESETCIEMIRRAYAAGADQELEACCQWLFENDYDVAPVCLRAARRPKPPSLKEQALKALIAINSNFHVSEPDASVIRAALESLDD